MRYRFYAIVLLLVLIFNIFRFTVPFIQYAFFKTYIAKNLCINKDKTKSCCEGKCFRDKQIKSINETHETESSKEKDTSKTSKNNEVKEFLLTHSIIPMTTEMFFRFITIPEMILCTKYVSAIFIPPQV